MLKLWSITPDEKRTMLASALIYAALMLVFGPGVILYGFIIILRRRVRLFRGKVLSDRSAVIAGFITSMIGIAFVYFL